MKITISLPEDDVEFLDAYAQSQGIASRSAVVHKAVRLLRVNELGEAYEQAFTSWDDEGEATAWDAVAADGRENLGAPRRHRGRQSGSPRGSGASKTSKFSRHGQLAV